MSEIIRLPEYYLVEGTFSLITIRKGFDRFFYGK